VSSAHQNSSYQCMLANSFQGTASTFAQPQSSGFLSMGTLGSVVFSPPIEHVETLYQLYLPPSFAHCIEMSGDSNS